MTKPNEEDKTVNQTNAAEPVKEVEIIEDDPIIAEMKEAEKQIEADAEKAKQTTDDTNSQKTGEDGKAKETKPDDKKEVPAVPKARFDEVLSERNLLRDQVGYLRGVLDTKDQMNSGTSDSGKTTQKTDKAQEGSKVDEIDAAIEAAEAKKLALAEKYDAGDISTVDLTKAQIEIDKEIRGLTDKREVARITSIQETTRSETNTALKAVKTADFINEQALDIQKNHPNVAVIDACTIRDAVWQQITTQALSNLAKQGINVKDASPQTKLKIIEEKARLTESYTPEALKAFLPEGFKAPSSTQQAGNGQTDNGQRKQSETALERAKKLELAESQPPSAAELGKGTDSGDLTDTDIERMTEDQIADLLQKAPHLVQRAVGKSAN